MRFSELVDTEGDRCLPKGAAPRRQQEAAIAAEYVVLSRRLANGFSKGNAGQSPVSKMVNPDPLPRGSSMSSLTSRQTMRRHFDSAARLLDDERSASETFAKAFARDAKARMADTRAPPAGDQRVMAYNSVRSQMPGALW